MGKRSGFDFSSYLWLLLDGSFSFYLFFFMNACKLLLQDDLLCTFVG
jgi:hypothetical protein